METSKRNNINMKINAFCIIIIITILTIKGQWSSPLVSRATEQSQCFCAYLNRKKNEQRHKPPKTII